MALSENWFSDASSNNSRVLPDLDKVSQTALNLPKAEQKASKNLNVDDWIQESFELAKDSVYLPLGAGNGPFSPSADYLLKTKELMAERGAVAGERLANLLNNELK